MNTDILAPQSSEERLWGVAAHLSAFVGFMLVPFGHVVGPLAVYLAQRDRSAFVAAHAKASLNFQITISIAAAICFVLAAAGWAAIFGVSGLASERATSASVVSFGLGCLTVAVWAVVAAVVLMVRGAIAADRGLPYRYPFAMTFVR